MRSLFAAALLLLTSTSVSAAGESARSDSRSGSRDAQSYARAFGVDVDEAASRLSLQPEIGALNAHFTEIERGTYAGLWIEHHPKFGIAALATDRHAMKRLKDQVKKTKFKKIFRVALAEHSLKGLEDGQAVSHHLARQLGMIVESEIILKANRVYLYTTEPDLLRDRLAERGLELPAGVEIIGVESLTTPTANIYAGLALSGGCTSGFSVQNSSGVRGITTAAHCPNTEAYNGVNLPYISGDITGDQDVQWHTAPGFTVTNQFYDGLSVRNITSTLARSGQAVGDYVCAYGITTDYKCGLISSTTLAPSHVTTPNATFIRVTPEAGSTADLSSPGDSGGPWFLGETAYGINVAEVSSAPRDAVYMAINYVSSLGVTVLTAP